MTTATLERAPEARPAPRFTPKGHHTEHIEGGVRPIPARLLALAWWCFIEGHVTMRQLRVVFAAAEMAQRRRVAGADRPLYRLEEVCDLVGVPDTERAARALRCDLKRLAALGLVVVEPHRIRFAKSADTLTVGEGGREAFAAFYAAFPNTSRTVPVPRRMLRALAAGFGRSRTGYIVATLITSIFWHRQSGLYRVDGRMKGSWIAETFGISRSAVTEARAHLVELDWLRPLEAQQWELNKWGVHDVINVSWCPGAAGRDGEHHTPKTPPRAPTGLPPDSVDNPGVPGDGVATGSGSPSGAFATGSGSPLNKLTSSKLENRNLSNRTGPSGGGDRERKGVGGVAPPTIRDVMAHDLADTDRLLELHRQAIEVGLAKGGQAGTLDFLSYANRARMRGKNAGGLLIWLLRMDKRSFITVADEEAAAHHLSVFYNGQPAQAPSRRSEKPERVLSSDEEIVERSIHIARQHRIRDPFDVARRVKQWTREQWDRALVGYRTTQTQHWYGTELEECYV